jgi:NB-ARC domain.
MQDLFQHLRNAKPCKNNQSKEEWLEQRAGDYPVKPKDLAGVPLSIPELPRGFGFRPEGVSQNKEGPLPGDRPTRERASSGGVFVVHGKGGSGKTAIVSSATRDEGGRSRFDRICFGGIGQAPNMRDLQRSRHTQQSGEKQDPKADEGRAQIALQTAARGQTGLLDIDDAWDASQVRALNCIDTDTHSRAIVTTRIQGLVPGAPEIALGLMPRDAAVQIIFDVAGVADMPPYSDLACEAADALRIPAAGTGGGRRLAEPISGAR